MCLAAKHACMVLHMENQGDIAEQANSMYREDSKAAHIHTT